MASNMLVDFGFYGTIVHSTHQKKMLISEKSVLGVKQGKIVINKSGVSLEEAIKECQDVGIDKSQLTELEEKQFLMPGLVDTHIHAPQYAITGTGYALQLLDWLNEYTFPNEARFSDLVFAENCYRKVVRRTLINGTTTACYFATIHKDASLKLADIMMEMGQRGFVGKVCMDKNSPDYYIESTDQSLKDTCAFIESLQTRSDGLVTACVTPRFAISCTPTLMQGLASIAKQKSLPIQTHMSENCTEIALVRQDYSVEEYAEIYEKYGLLTERTILAHCTHSSPEELAILKRYDCGIAHCANSNISLRSGMMDVRLVEENGVKLGLGTDVSGGYSPSISDSMRKTVEVSKLISCVIKAADSSYKAIDHTDAFHLATLGGAKVMGLDGKIGNFEVGKEFDALVIDADALNSPFDVFPTDKVHDVVQKFLYLGDDRNIKNVYVRGKQLQI